MKKTFVRALLLAALSIFSADYNLFSAKPPTHSKADSKRFSAAKKPERGDANLPVKIKPPPGLFEENKGQFGESVKFLSRGKNFNLLLGSNEIVYQMTEPDCQSKKKDAARRAAKPCKTVSLKMKLLGAERGATLGGVDEAVTKTGYALGGDAGEWIDGVRNYNSARYRNVYRGIDAVFRGSGESIEYDFHVAPEADPNSVRLKFDGAKKFQIDADGDLVFKFKGVELRHRKPVAYQIIAGERREISARYVLLGKTTVGFKVGEYDRRAELIIDPDSLRFVSRLPRRLGQR